MRPLLAFLLFCIVLGFSGNVFGRDDVLRYPIADPMNTVTASQFSRAQFYFGDQKHPRVIRRIGTYTSERTTNAFGKSDKEACHERIQTDHFR